MDSRTTPENKKVVLELWNNIEGGGGGVLGPLFTGRKILEL